MKTDEGYFKSITRILEGAGERVMQGGLKKTRFGEQKKKTPKSRCKDNGASSCSREAPKDRIGEVGAAVQPTTSPSLVLRW